MFKIRFAINYFCNFSGSRGFATFILSVILSANIFFISSLFAEMVEIPCTLESPTPIKRHRWFEVINSDLQIWKYLVEPLIKDIKIFRPIRRNGVESFQLRQDSITECDGGNGEAIQAVVSTSEISNDKGHRKSTRNFPAILDDDISQIIHKLLKGALFGLIISLLYLLFAQRYGSPGAVFIGDPVEPFVRHCFSLSFEFGHQFKKPLAFCTNSINGLRPKDLGVETLTIFCDAIDGGLLPEILAWPCGYDFRKRCGTT